MADEFIEAAAEIALTVADTGNSKDTWRKTFLRVAITLVILVVVILVWYHYF